MHEFRTVRPGGMLALAASVGACSFYINVYEPALQFIAADHSTVTKFDDFTRVIVTNPDDFEVRAGIVYIVWTDPALPGPQQARRTARFPSPVVLPAIGKVTVPVNDAVQSVMAAGGDQAAVSVKIYPVP